MKSPDLNTILTSWETGPATIVLYVSVMLAGLAYVIAAARRSPRGRRWPRSRTVCFVGGVVLFGVIYGSGLQVYEDHPAVHVVQHMLVMMAVPPLVLLAAPITLLLRTLRPARRGGVVRFLSHPVFRPLSHHRAPLLLCIDYYLAMFLYQLTPIHTVTEQSAVLHFAVHQYFLVCGLCFWFPIAAVDPVRLRLDNRTKQRLVALGLPAFGLLGAIELAAGDSSTGWAYIASGAALTVAGSLLVASQARRVAPRPGSAFATARGFAADAGNQRATAIAGGAGAGPLCKDSLGDSA